jgi:N-acetylneuraminic acid mutarotase
MHTRPAKSHNQLITTRFMLSLKNNFAFALAMVVIAGCDSAGPEPEPEPEPAILNWKQLPEFPGPGRQEAVGFWIGDKLYLGLGYGRPNDPQITEELKDFYEYDALAKTWTKKADFPGDRISGPSSFSIGGKGYVGQDSNGGNEREEHIWEYNPASDTWTLFGTYGIGSNDSGDGRAQVIDGKAYLDFGGGTIFVFNPAIRSFTLAIENPHPSNKYRRYAANFSLNGKLFVCTGSDSNNSPTYTKTTFEFDPVTLSFTLKAYIPVSANARIMATGFAFDGKGYILGGSAVVSGQGVILNDVWQYDQHSDSWKQFNDYPGSGRGRIFVAESDTRACVGAGYRELNFVKDFWMLEKE